MVFLWNLISLRELRTFVQKVLDRFDEVIEFCKDLENQFYKEVSLESIKIEKDIGKVIKIIKKDYDFSNMCVEKYITTFMRDPICIGVLTEFFNRFSIIVSKYGIRKHNIQKLYNDIFVPTANEIFKELNRPERLDYVIVIENPEEGVEHFIQQLEGYSPKLEKTIEYRTIWNYHYKQVKEAFEDAAAICPPYVKDLKIYIPYPRQRFCLHKIMEKDFTPREIVVPLLFDVIVAFFHEPVHRYAQILANKYIEEKYGIKPYTFHDHYKLITNPEITFEYMKYLSYYGPDIKAHTVEFMCFKKLFEKLI